MVLAVVVAAGCGGETSDAPPAPTAVEQADGAPAEPASASLADQKVYSRQDGIIRDFFGDRRDGVFVDIGCYHWRDGNNTLFLEERLGWTGIAVDAQAHLAAGYAEHRPGTRFFHYLVGERSGETGTLYVAGPLSSTKAEHLDKYPGLEGQRGRAFEVATITMDDLLDQAGIEKVDFLNLDIEEAEPAALRGFDIQRFRPELVCVEASTEAVRAFLTSYFAENGYERIDAYLEHDAYNWYFRPAR